MKLLLGSEKKRGQHYFSKIICLVWKLCFNNIFSNYIPNALAQFTMLPYKTNKKEQHYN